MLSPTAMASGDSERVQQIGIIGAGPSGLAALKTILDTPQYKAGRWIPTAFEARPNVGGVWFPSGSTSTPGNPPPSTPLYDSLTTNLPHPIMAFSSLSFPPSTPLFPKAEVVQTYLESYADVFGLRKHIHFNQRVVNADWAAPGHWVVHTQADREGMVDSEDENQEKDEWNFDLLLVCNGHHNVPQYPSPNQIPGLSTWLTAGRASHSMFYRNPSSIPARSRSSSSFSKLSASPPSDSSQHQFPHLTNQTVLVIGGGPSGSDITAELVPLAARVLHSFSPTSAAARHAARDANFNSVTKADIDNTKNAPFPPPHSVILKPRVTRFSLSPEDAAVYFEDGSEERGVDFCVLATGYEVAFPFFGTSSPNLVSTSSPNPSLSPLSPSPNLNSPGSTLSANGNLPFQPNSNSELNPYPNPYPNFNLLNALVPSNISRSHIDTHLRNTSWSVFPLARHLFGMPGCGFSQSTSSPASASASNLNSASNRIATHHSDSNPHPSPSLTAASASDSNWGRTSSTTNSEQHEHRPRLPPPTSLAFLGLLVRVAPLPLVEAQARAALAAFASGSGSGTCSYSTFDAGERSAVDWKHEEKEVLRRWEELRGRWEVSQLGLGEEEAVREVGESLREKAEQREIQMRTFISREWQRFAEETKQFDYRDALDDLAVSLSSVSKSERAPVQAPARVRVKQWERHFYAEKGTLRKAWRELERKGVAEEWARGVGEGNGEGNGEDEWVAFMDRVLEFGKTL